MTGRQKTILALMALLDLAVVIMLGSSVLLTQHKHRSTAESAILSPCSMAIAQSLPGTFHPQVSATPFRLAITLTPDSGDAQVFWEVLDVLAAMPSSRCPIPETVLIMLRWPEAVDIALIDGDDFCAWARGQLSDVELAEKARYRHFTGRP